MDLAETLRILIADFAEMEIPRPTVRDVKLASLPRKADVLIGMRRSGKTWFLFQELHRLLSAGVGRDRLFYLNFEDERLLPMGTEHLQLVPELFFARYPESRDQECWFFLDEVHRVPGWELFVRRLLDGGGLRLVLTGSSSRLLAREIATSLRGRALATELLPFSFGEALAHAGVPVPDRWPPAARTRSHLQSRFQRYTEEGGFPEVQGLEPDMRRRVLRDYLDVVLLRDVVERHRVANVIALRYLLRSLLRAPASLFSIHRVHMDLRSQGVPVGKDLLHEYLAHLEDAFLLFPVSRYSRSERQRMVNPRKCYLVDPALAGVVAPPGARDLGRILENLVYLALRRRGLESSYYVTASGHEVDFLASSPGGSPCLVQVCASLAERSTRDRELRALSEAMAELGQDEATLVTLGEDEAFETAGGTIRVVPAWKWLLAG